MKSQGPSVLIRDNCTPPVEFDIADQHTGIKLMRNSARLASEDIAVMSQWSVLMRSWLRVLVVAGFTGAAVFTALALVPARYVATTEIRLTAPDAAAATIIASLKSRDLARKVVADLDLQNLPAFGGANAIQDAIGSLDRLSGRHARRPESARNEQVLAALAQNLDVKPGQEEGSIIVSATARTPDLAARIADHLVHLQLASAEPTGTVASGHEKHLLTDELARIEAEIARIKRLSDEAVDDQRRNDLAEALAQSERERSDAAARAEAVRALLDKGKVEAIAELQTSPSLHQLIGERVRLEVQKTAAERSLASDHPRIRDLKARLSELRWQMFREATAIAEALDAEVKSATARETEARARLARADASAGTSGAASDTARLAALEQDAAAKRRALENLSDQEPGVPRAPVHAAFAERVSPAQAIAIPAFPRKGQFALLAAVSILMIGFVAVIVRALLFGNRRSVAETGFADLAATARDRADVRLDTAAFEARPIDAPVTDTHPTEDVQAAVAPHVQSSEPGQFVILSTTTDTARHLAGRAMGRKGHRTLLVADGIDGTNEARDMITSLATAGRRCVLVDWSRDGKGLAASLGLQTRPGMNDLLDGRARFDDVIVRLPESDVHFIAAGSASADPLRSLDAGWINLVLDALDEAYDHIVVVAQIDEARSLFETIEGRFDAGIVMSDRRSHGSTINAGPGVFLGYEVTEIYIVQVDLAQRQGAARRLKRTRRQAAA